MAITEGTTARNPKTNERIVYKGGSWQPMTSSGIGTAGKTGIAAAQGLTFGFADEIAGAGSSLFGGDYDKTRDRIRLSQEEFKKDYPVGSAVAELAGSVPTMLLPGGQIRGATMAAKAARVLAPAVGYGALGGAGASESEDISGLLQDASFGGVFGGATGVGASGVGKVFGMAGRRGKELLGKQFSVNPARERLAQLLERDAAASKLRRFGVNQEGPTRAAAKLRALGQPDRAPIAATGENVLSELDTLSQLPGSAKQMLEDVSPNYDTSKKALVDAASEALGTKGKKYNESLDVFKAAKKAESEPFYSQLEGLVVKVDPELDKILNKIGPARGEVEALSILSGKPMKVSSLTVGKTIDFNSLDTIKKTLFDLASEAKNNGKTVKAGFYNEIRRELTDKMDDLSPKDGGISVYRKAREAFGGPAAMEEAAKEGRMAMTMQADELAEVMKNLEGSQLDAFRIGATQSLKNQLGEKAGQTKIIESFNTSNTKDRLRQIFGNDFREFNKAILQEKSLKNLTKAGKGSATFKRQGTERDQGVAMEAIEAASSVASSNPIAQLGMLSRAYRRLGMPENTRNELARMLTLKGPAAQRELLDLSDYMRQKQLSKEQADKLAGLLGGQSSRQIDERFFK